MSRIIFVPTNERSCEDECYTCSMSIVDYFFIFGAKYLYLVVLLIAFIVFVRAKRNVQKRFFTLFLFSFPLVFIVARTVSGFYFNPRPFVVEHFTPLVAHEPDNGFPSDHLLLLSSVCVLIYLFRRQISYWLIAISIIVGISRVYVGVHHTLDIFGSILISTAIILLVYKILKSFAWYRKLSASQ